MRSDSDSTKEKDCIGSKKAIRRKMREVNQNSTFSHNFYYKGSFFKFEDVPVFFPSINASPCD